MCLCHFQDLSVSTIFTEHKTKVNVARFSPNGEWIASGDNGGKVIIWGVKSKNIKLEVQVNRKVIDLSWYENIYLKIYLNCIRDKLSMCFKYFYTSCMILDAVCFCPLEVLCCLFIHFYKLIYGFRVVNHPQVRWWSTNRGCWRWFRIVCEQIFISTFVKLAFIDNVIENFYKTNEWLHKTILYIFLQCLLDF